MATSTFDKVSDRITHGLHDAGERIVDIKDDAARDLGRRLDGLGKLMRSHPLLTIAIGLAAGYVLARITPSRLNMQNTAKPEVIRGRLASTFDGLHRRVLYARAMLTPRTYIANPWFRVAAAAVVGYRLGSPAARLGQPATVLGALLRTVLVNVATSSMRDAISPQRRASGANYTSPS